MIWKKFIFDLDGTLIDSAPVVASILDNMRIARGMRPLSIEFYREWSSLGGGALVGRALEVDSDSVSQAVAEFRHIYANSPTPPESVFATVRETLTILRNEGAALAVCSNKPEHLCRKVLGETGLIHLFNGIVGGDTTASQKPSREPVDRALAFFDTGPALFVGDSSIDQQAARAAKLPFVYFTGGYDSSVDDAYIYARIDRAEQLIGLEGDNFGFVPG